MEKVAKSLGLKTNPGIFFTSAGLVILSLVIFLLFSEWIAETFTVAREWVVSELGWFFIFGVSAWLIFLVVLALSKFGKLRLGADDDKPAYSNLSWFAMLFAGGIGTVLMFWGVAEPISHFTEPPFAGVEPFSAQAAQDAMSISLYHLSLHTWAIFTVPGLAFGFFIYRYKLPMRVSSVFYPLLKEKIYGPIGRTIDVFAILGTVFGLAVSVGLGTNQINSGLSALLGVPDSVLMKVLIVAVVAGAATISVSVGLDKGIKVLSNINILAAVGLMLFIFFLGDTIFLLRQFFESTGYYMSNLVQLAFWNDAMADFTPEGWGWQGAWTVFYWAWTVTWAPFMGVFLARISRGRTIRQFVGGVLVAPAAFTIVWFVTFGWSAMEIDGVGGDGGSISSAVAENVPLALFALLEEFPMTALMQGISIVLVAIFLVTSVDSGALVVDMLGSGREEAGPVRQRAFWGILIGAIAAVLMWLGGDTGIVALQQVITVVGLPIFIMVCAMLVALVMGLVKQRRLVDPMDRQDFLREYGHRLMPDPEQDAADAGEIAERKKASEQEIAELDETGAIPIDPTLVDMETDDSSK